MSRRRTGTALLSFAALLTSGCAPTYIVAAIIAASSGGGGGGGAAIDPPNGAPGVTAPAVTRVGSGDAELRVAFLVRDPDGDPVTLRASVFLPGDASKGTVDRLVPMQLSAPDRGRLELGAEGAENVVADVPTAPTDVLVSATWRVADSIAPLTLGEVTEGVRIVVTARDPEEAEGEATSSAFIVGNTPPVATDVRVLGGATTLSGNVQIGFTLSDSTSDAATVRIEIDELGGPSGIDVVRQTSATLFDLDATGRPLATSPSGVAHIVVWRSQSDIQVTAPSVRIRVVPVDGDPGAEVAIGGSFRVVNNQAPRATIGELALSPDRDGRVTLDIGLFDAESHPVDVVIQWQRAGEAFPDLDQFGDLEDPDVRELVLSDPAMRAALQVITPGAPPVLIPADTVDPALGIPGDQVQVTALLAEPRLLAPSALVGEPIEVLRGEASFAGPGPAGPVAFEPGGGLLVGTLASPLVSSSGALFRVDVVTGQASPLALDAPLDGTPTGLAVSADGGAALVTVGLATSTGRLLHVDLGVTPATLTEVAAGLPSPRAVAFVDEERALVVTDDGAGGAVHLVHLSSGGLTQLTAGLSAPRGLAVAPGRRVAWVAERDAGCVVALDLETRSRRVLTTTGEIPVAPVSVAVDAEGRLIVATDEPAASGRLLRIDPRTGTSTLVLGGLDGARGVAAEPDGAVAVYDDATGGRLRIAGGVVQRRVVIGSSLGPPRLQVDASWVPPLAGGERLRLAGARRRMRGLASAPGGASHSVVWDAEADRVPQQGVHLKATPFDTSRGAAIVTAVAAVVRSFGTDPIRELALPPSGGGMAAIADLDSDGLLDAVTRQGEVFYQRVSSTFPLAEDQLLDVGEGPSVCASADLDGDGDRDLVAASAGSGIARGDVRVFLQTAPRVFTLASTVTTSVSFDPLIDAPPALADVDGDGDLDVAVAWSDGSSAVVTLLLQGAPGVLLPTLTVPGASPSFGDMDGDGDLDLLVLLGGDVVAHRRTGPPAAPLFDPMPSPLGVPRLSDVGGPGRDLVRDIDGDGDLDLAIVESSAFQGLPAGAARVFLQVAPLQFEATPSYDLEGASMGADASGALPRLDLIDTDADGDLDLVVRAPGAASLLIARQVRAGGFEAAPQVALSLPGRRLADVAEVFAEDVDGDGDLDVSAVAGSFVLGFGSTRVARLRAAPDAEIELTTQDFLVNDLSVGVALGDLDGDGDTDLLHFNGGFILSVGTVYRGSLFGVAQVAPLQLDEGALEIQLLDPPAGGSTDGSYLDAKLVDFDQDGDIDIVAFVHGGFLDNPFDPGRAAVQLLLQRSDLGTPGARVFEPVTIGVGAVSGDRFSGRIEVQDLDGDGDLDVSLTRSTGVTSAFLQVAPLQLASGSPPAGLGGPPVGESVRVGDGQFRDPNLSFFELGALAADVDGDGAPERVELLWPDATLRLFFERTP